MDIQRLIQTISQDPNMRPALDAAAQELSDVAPEQVQELIKMLEFALRQPKQYAEIRAAAIADGMMDEEDLPEQFDAQIIMAALVVLYRLLQGPSEAMARGGLSRVRTLARQGRFGDTMLAHITPREAEILRERGGAGTINPKTGLPEFFLKKLLKAVLPIAINFIAPGLGTAIGAAFGASGAAAAMIGQAVIGGVSAGLTGGNVLQGAVLGGLGGGLGTAVGGAANTALGLNLGTTGQNLLGGALVGGAMGAATGQGFGRGALMGAAGAGLGQATQGLGEGAMGAGIGSAGRMAGNMLTVGFKPKEALLGGALSGLAAGLTYQAPGATPARPSEAVLAEMRDTPSGMSKLGSEFRPGELAISPETGQPYMPAGQAGAAPQQPQSFLQRVFGQGQPAVQQASGTGLAEPPVAGAGGSPFSLKNVGTLAMLGSLAGGRPPEVNQAISTMTPAQQEYFNRPSIKWDWDKMQNDASARNMSLTDYMSLYWPVITSGAYNVAVNPQAQPQAEGVPAMAMGGAYAAGGGPLGAVARLVRGGGSGRDDTVNARLSDGEYVMDAETVAMLGDGSTDEGARRLDKMRAQLRKHKGKTLVRGKFSPNAKSPLAYLKGV